MNLPESVRGVGLLQLVLHVDDVGDGGDAGEEDAEAGQEVVGGHHHAGLAMMAKKMCQQRKQGFEKETATQESIKFNARSAPR